MNDFKKPRVSWIFEDLPKSMEVYSGTYRYRMDDKGRLTMPSSIRNSSNAPEAAANDQEQTPKVKLGVLALPTGLIDELIGPVEQQPSQDPVASILLVSAFQQLLEGDFGEQLAPYAEFSTLDAQGRIVLPPFVDKDRPSDVSLLGRINRFDLF